jgi:hypothetical protein
MTLPDPSHGQPTEADIAVFRVVSEHFRNDLMIFWQQTGLFLVAVGALVTIYVQSQDPRSLISWVVWILGLLLTAFWFWVGWNRARLIDVWRGHVIKIDQDVDRYGFYNKVESDVRKSWWKSPTTVTKFLPGFLLLAWIALMIARHP